MRTVVALLEGLRGANRVSDAPGFELGQAADAVHQLRPGAR